MSVQKGVFPSKLKEAKVIPVYKIKKNWKNVPLDNRP